MKTKESFEQKVNATLRKLVGKAAGVQASSVVIKSFKRRWVGDKSEVFGDYHYDVVYRLSGQSSEMRATVGEDR